MQTTYEAPQLTTVGSLKDMTLGEGWEAWDDSIRLFGLNIPLPGELS